MENSLRKNQDGITYFGYQEDTDENEPYVDYMILPYDQEYNDKYIGRHLQIAFNEENQKYYIKDLGFGLGTFIKVISALPIKDNTLINIGETFIVFAFDKSNNIEINIKIFSGNVIYEPIILNSKMNSIVSIGRDYSCDVSVGDKMLSRIHCTLTHNEEKEEWFISDGNNEKNSTNGTWIYAADDTEIIEEMVFKTNHNLFKCKLEL